MSELNQNTCSYQRGCRVVAYIDLVLSCLVLVLANFTFAVVVIKGYNPHQGASRLIWQHDVIFLAIRVVLEFISIFLAVKLLKHTKAGANEQNTDRGVFWCNMWIIGCVIWIFITLWVICELNEARVKPGILVILGLMMVLRAGAIKVVFEYKRELGMDTVQQLQAVHALVNGLQAVC